MPITLRASAWLATLPRETPMPTADVERLIVDAGHTAHAPWLDFQEHYAGYVEQIGPGEEARWGLARAADSEAATVFFEPNRIYYVPPAAKWLSEALRCADVNPMHEYELGSDGRFNGLGGPAATFEMKLERHGLMHEFRELGGDLTRRTIVRNTDEPEHQQLLHDVASGLVREASDKGQQFFVDAQRMVQYSPFVKQLTIWPR